MDDNCVWAAVGSEIHIISSIVSRCNLLFCTLFFNFSFYFIFLFIYTIYFEQKNTQENITLQLQNIHPITAMVLLPSKFVWVADTEGFISIWDAQVFPIFIFATPDGM
jgi:hypothetical protein